jgi:hypothetical protein
MNTLGFKICRCKEGFLPIFALNEDGLWENKVIDIRDYIELFNTDSDCQDRPFMQLMSFSEKGTYITISRIISGRTADNIAAWLFIPNNIIISGEEVYILINQVKIELQKCILDDESVYKSLFAQSYQETQSVTFKPSSTGYSCALRRIVSTKDFQQIVGVDRYQPYYTSYRFIILQDDTTLPLKHNNVTDISTNEITHYCVLCPPNFKEIFPQSNGIQVFLDGKEFKNAQLIKAGAEIKLTYKKGVFNDISQSITVPEDPARVTPGTLEWEISISWNDLIGRIKLVDANGEIRPNDQISQFIVNNQKLSSYGEKLRIKESEAKSAKIEIQMRDYETEKTDIDLVDFKSDSMRRVYSYNIKRKIQEHKWSVNNGNFILSGKNQEVYQEGAMPIPGYKLKSGHLEYVSKKYFYLLIGAAIPCVVTLLVFLFVSVSDWYDNHSFHWQLDFPPMTITATTKKTNNSTTKNQGVISDNNTQSLKEDSLACKYLDASTKDSHVKWNKDSMEQFKVLKGLFEEIHYRKYSKILMRKETLKSSTRFTLLINAIESNLNPHDTVETFMDGNEIDFFDYIEQIKQK